MIRLIVKVLYMTCLIVTTGVQAMEQTTDTSTLKKILQRTYFAFHRKKRHSSMPNCGNVFEKESRVSPLHSHSSTTIDSLASLVSAPPPKQLTRLESCGCIFLDASAKKIIVH